MSEMKNSFYLFGLAILLACTPQGEQPRLEKLPYFDLKGFLDLELKKLDGHKVLKTSKINGEEKEEEQTYSEAQWKEEFDYFYQADINLPSLATSYSTDIQVDYLIHELLPESEGKVKEIRIRYAQSYPAAISFKIKEENFFYTSTTLGVAYMNQATGKMDHYSLETTQKVMFLDPTHIKISGILK